MDEGADAERDVVTDDVVVGLEHAVLLGVAHDRGAGVQRAAGADGHQAPLDELAAVVEDPAPDPHAEQTPDQRFERRPVEEGHPPALDLQLPVPLVPPEVGVVDRAELGPEPPEPRHEVLDADGNQEAHQQHHDERRGEGEETEPVGQLEGGEQGQQAQRRLEPPDEHQEGHRAQVVLVLGREDPAEPGGVRVLLERGVPQDRAGDLERR